MSRTLNPREPQPSQAKAITLRRREEEISTALFKRGFQLAHFIVPDHSVAISILVDALENLRVQSHRETKRLYWRDKHPEQPVRRMIRSPEDLLQWLIMFESEGYERAQEAAGRVSLKSMTVRYVKHIVQLTTALSCFYVNVGVMRLLHSYSTVDAQQAYETLTNRSPGSDEYRRAKATLMDKLSRRFADFLRITRIERGELRFETCDDQDQWRASVEECLKAFTPWSTQLLCSRLAQSGLASGAAGVDRNDLEMKWSHLFIEPTCFRRLLRELSLRPPETKLALPRFVMSDKHENNSDINDCAPNSTVLSQEDLDEIERRLAMRDTRRRNINPRLVTLSVDGVRQKQFDLAKTNHVRLELSLGTSLIEIWGQDDQGDLLLAAHMVSYAENAFDSSQATATVGRGILKFDVAPVSGGESARATLRVDYKPQFQWTRLLNVRFVQERTFKAIAPYALAGVTVGLAVWGVTSTVYVHRIGVLERQLKQAHTVQRQLPPSTAKALVFYRLIPDDQMVRGQEMAGIPEISLLLHSPAIGLELPLSQTDEGTVISAELKSFSGDQTLLTINFPRETRTNAGSHVEIVVSADLLRPDTYYTVQLHSPNKTNRFTFKVIAK